MEELIGKELGPYQVVSELGKGAMAKVYKAYQPSTDRHVALKVLLPEYTRHTTFLDRFLQESQLIARLEHPHIVPVYDFGQAGGYFYIVMRLVQAGTLGERFHGQPFSLGEIRQIVTQIGDALDYAHSEGVVHRDVKPKNILLDHRDNALLTDFGIAKDLESDAKITQLGRTVGTPTYMSPEQIQGDPLDGRSDIYSLGVVLYQLATGHLPYHADTPEEICLQHLRDPVPSPRIQNPDLPETLDLIITTMLAKKPKDRYATAGEVVRLIEDATLAKTLLTNDVPSSVEGGKEDRATQISPVANVIPTSLALEGSKPTVLSPVDRTAKTSPTEKDSGATLRVPSEKIGGAPLTDEDSGATLPIPSVNVTEPVPRRRGWNRKAWAIIGGVTVLVIAGVLLLVSPGLLALFSPGFPGGPPFPPPPPGQLLLADDFSNKRLEESDKDGVQTGYEAGQYIIAVNVKDTTGRSSVGDVYDDFIVEVEAIQLNESDEGGYGLLLRDDERKFYAFEISGEGFFEFYKVIEDDRTTIFVRQSEAIRPDGSNTLRVEVVGSDFFFFINDTPVGYASDPDLKQGGISLMVEESGARVAFDNLKIWTVAK